MMFQAFLRYEFSWQINPMAKIFAHISTVKMPIKTGSSSSSCKERIVLSLLAILLSMLITTQLDMIVMMITHSKGGHVTNQTKRRLIGFVAERMKRLEGPPFSRTIAPFFLFGILPPPDYSCLELVLELVSGTSPRISPPPKLSSRGTRWGEAPHHPLLPPPPPPPLS